MNYLNHRLPPFERNLKPTRFFALVNRELNEVFSFGVYKEKFVCGRAVFNESNGFQVRIRCLFSWVVLLRFRAYSEEDFRIVRLSGKNHRTIALNPMKGKVDRSGSESQIDGIKLFAVKVDRMIQRAAQAWSSCIRKKFKNHSAFNQQKFQYFNQFVAFYGLLPSVLKFCLAPLFSHALGKAS